MEKGYTGLGIGLTLVKSLVELHGGTVQVQSGGPDQGSEFNVRLPILSDQADDPDDSCAPPSEADLIPSTPRQRVLVVDDNQAAAHMLSVVVRLLGHEVEMARDGREAIERADAFRPDVILMDLGMPKMNGYDAARHIRQQPWGKGMRLVALTGWGQEEDRRRTKEAGFDFH